MRTTNVYIRSGVVCAVTEELPDKPHCLDDAIDWKKYEKALQRIKDNAPEFGDQDLAFCYLWEKYDPKMSRLHFKKCIKDDTFYPIELEVTITGGIANIVNKVCPKCRTTTPSSCHSMQCPMREVARIKEPVVEKIEKSEPVSYTQEDGLFNTDYREHIENTIFSMGILHPEGCTKLAIEIISDLEKHGFTITRKVN